MRERAIPTSLLLIFLLVAVRPLQAQDFVREALASLPPQTIRVEYSAPAKLRQLSNYAALRERYVGPRLRALEEKFAELGVRENNIDEIVLGWQAGGETMDLSGLVAGRLDAKALAERADERGLAPSTVGDISAYCVEAGVGSTCVVVLKNSLAIFGPLPVLEMMAQTRAGQAPNLTSQERVLRLVEEVRGKGPIWGVALGNAIPDWFRAWMPAQGNLQLDWSRAFQAVEAIAYSVNTGDRVRLEIQMDCSTTGEAERIKQVFEGLKLFQQLAWQNQNPNRPNPFESLEIGLTDQRVSLKMTTGYAELESAVIPGIPSH